MAGRFAQALGRLPAELVAETCDPARGHPHAAWRQRRPVSILGFDQLDPGGDVCAIGAPFYSDPHVTLSAILPSCNNYAWRYDLGNLLPSAALRVAPAWPSSDRIRITLRLNGAVEPAAVLLL
jgi:hypothetical protein